MTPTSTRSMRPSRPATIGRRSASALSTTAFSSPPCVAYDAADHMRTEADLAISGTGSLRNLTGVSGGFAEGARSKTTPAASQSAISSQTRADQALRDRAEFDVDVVHRVHMQVPVRARGGGSRARSLHTHDDRYIIKEVNKREFRQFVSPAFISPYFEHQFRAFCAGDSTILARIYGAFRMRFTRDG